MKVAIIGASRDREKFGNKAVRAYLAHGDEVFPVNPKEEEIEGQKSFASVLDVPDDLDRISIYLPPEIGLKIAEEVIKKGAKEVFLNPGAESPELIAKLRDAKINVRTECSIRAIGYDPDKL